MLASWMAAHFVRLVLSSARRLANSDSRQIPRVVHVLFTHTSCGTWECRATGAHQQTFTAVRLSPIGYECVESGSLTIALAAVEKDCALSSVALNDLHVSERDRLRATPRQRRWPRMRDTATSRGGVVAGSTPVSPVEFLQVKPVFYQQL